MVVLMGLELLSTEQYKEIIIIGDFELVIKGLRNHSMRNLQSLQRIIKGETFRQIEYIIFSNIKISELIH